MQPIQLFDLASRQAEWLTIRQQVVAGNIANANTPKFHAKDVTPFDAVLDKSDIAMARTNPAHLSGNDFSNSGDIDVKEAALDQKSASVNPAIRSVWPRSFPSRAISSASTI